MLFGTFPATSGALARLSISTSPTTHNPSGAGLALWAVPGIASESPQRVRYNETIPTTRTVEVPEAGTYTYYVVADGGAENADAHNNVFHLTTQMQAQFFPAP